MKLHAFLEVARGVPVVALLALVVNAAGAAHARRVADRPLAPVFISADGHEVGAYYAIVLSRMTR